MRIRKDRKLTPSMIWSTAATPSMPNPPQELMQPHICVVNHSPWDVSPLLPPLSLDYPPNNFLSPPILSTYLQHNLLSNQVEEKKDNICPINESLVCDYSIPNHDSCHANNSMKISCDHEKSTLVLPNPPSIARRNNKGCTMDPPRHRGRPRKEIVIPSISLPAASTNASEFYYYSEFGPRWGKRRGSEYPHKPVLVEENNDETNRGKMKVCLSCSKIEKTCDELDYTDDEEDNYDQKHSRKRVKAKSLKSLI